MLSCAHGMDKLSGNAVTSLLIRTSLLRAVASKSDLCFAEGNGMLASFVPEAKRQSDFNHSRSATSKWKAFASVTKKLNIGVRKNPSDRQNNRPCGKRGG